MGEISISLGPGTESKLSQKSRTAAQTTAGLQISGYGVVCLYHHFHYYATFLFKTPLSTLQYASVNHTLYGKCVMLPQLN